MHVICAVVKYTRLKDKKTSFKTIDLLILETRDFILLSTTSHLLFVRPAPNAILIISYTLHQQSLLEVWWPWLCVKILKLLTIHVCSIFSHNNLDLSKTCTKCNSCTNCCLNFSNLSSKTLKVCAWALDDCYSVKMVVKNHLQKVECWTHSHLNKKSTKGLSQKWCKPITST